MPLHNRAQVLLFHPPRMSNARNLEFRSCRRYLRVQARAGTCHQVGWDRNSGILRLKSLHVALHALQQILVRGAQIRAATGRRIISSAGVRRPRVKISRSRERLANDSRPHELSILLDELSVRAVAKEYLCQCGDSEWVNDAKHDCCY